MSLNRSKKSLGFCFFFKWLIFIQTKTDFTDTSNTTVYTSPAATTSIIKSILVSEDSGNADTITVTLTSGASVFNLFKTKAVGSNTTIELLSQPYNAGERNFKSTSSHRK